MRKRHKARIYALQALYAIDIRQDAVSEVLAAFVALQDADEQIRLFVRTLVEGTVACQQDIDCRIERSAENWRIERMAVIDRNIIRLATYELLHCPEIPPNVSLNEAVELAKRFGDDESGRFVNGVLDTINKKEAVAHAAESAPH